MRLIHCVCVFLRGDKCAFQMPAPAGKGSQSGAALESRPVLPCSHSLLCPHGRQSKGGNSSFRGSGCGPGSSSSVSITWAFVRSAHSEMPPPDLLNQKLTQVPQQSDLTSPPGALLTRKFEKHGFRENERSCQGLRRLRECGNPREAKESRQSSQKYKSC